MKKTPELRKAPKLIETNYKFYLTEETAKIKTFVTRYEDEDRFYEYELQVPNAKGKPDESVMLYYRRINPLNAIKKLEWDFNRIPGEFGFSTLRTRFFYLMVDAQKTISPEFARLIVTLRPRDKRSYRFQLKVKRCLENEQSMKLIIRKVKKTAQELREEKIRNKVMAALRNDSGNFMDYFLNEINK